MSYTPGLALIECFLTWNGSNFILNVDTPELDFTKDEVDRPTEQAAFANIYMEILYGQKRTEEN